MTSLGAVLVAAMLLLAAVLAVARTRAEGFEVEAAIVGGKYADGRLHPYFVQLGGCGGVLIAPNVVLTAGHCVPSIQKAGFVFVGQKQASWPSPEVEGALGQRGREAYLEGMQKYTAVHAVSRVVLHPQYKEHGTGESSTATNDIAVVFLATPSQARPAKLPTKALAPNSPVTVIGRGMESAFDPDTAWAQEMAPPLKLATLQHVPRPQCLRILDGDKPAAAPNYKALKTAISHPGIFCVTSYRDKTTVCHGDSGSPAMVGGTVVGIASAGMPGCGFKNAKANSVLGMYADVYQYLPFIRDTMKQNNNLYF